MPSPQTDPSLLPAHILASEIAAHRLSPVDLVTALLDRIQADDGKLHAFVEVYGEAARLAAEAADPHDDLRGTAEYKRNVVRVFCQRGLQAAAAAAAA